jgi:hypothetical protein
MPAAVLTAGLPLPRSSSSIDGNYLAPAICHKTESYAYLVEYQVTTRCIHLLTCFLAAQGNRFMPLTMHKAASSLQLKIIAPDRPGIGSSSHLPKGTVQQYPADIVEICQQLGVQHFSVMASSAGTMYALALTLAPETRDMVVGKVCALQL